jgi:hypothetical protein
MGVFLSGASLWSLQWICKTAEITSLYCFDSVDNLAELPASLLRSSAAPPCLAILIDVPPLGFSRVLIQTGSEVNHAPYFISSPAAVVANAFGGGIAASSVDIADSRVTGAAIRSPFTTG